jgi:cytochrome oxidase Cu insertion factor (SCO1/SenC/PrrC family)
MMTTMIRRGFVLGFLTFVVLLSACGGTESPPREKPAAGSPSNDSRSGRQSDGGAPDFNVETFSGERFSLAEQKGTPVVLNFWESW